MLIRLVPHCLLLAALAASASAQQRIEFQRQKFDRSRFERPDPSARPTPTAPVPAPAMAEPAMAEPAAPAPAPAPMVTQAPAAPAAPVDNPASCTFSADAPAPAPVASPAVPTTTSTAAPGVALFSADATLPAGPPPVSYPAGITPEEKAAYDAPLFDQVPAKWYDNAKDFEELFALSKKSGACLVVYFKNFAISNEKGLCNWFEKAIGADIKWRKAMKYYIKLELNVPGNSVVEELMARFRVTKTPAIFVVKPGSTMNTRLQVFDYVQGTRPEPRDIDAVLESLRTASTPAYQTLF